MESPNGRTSDDTIAEAMGAVMFQMTRWQRPNELLQRSLLPKCSLANVAPVP
uniref:hypothetical protein n=1 Tax=Synechococcus sp. UW106 TaxID=368495 RepID=UPI0014839313|nr:hypothetical protein [Synechococcus sp. UW106]